MSAKNGWCDARGYDAKDMENLVETGTTMPWQCELPHGHGGEHDMPNLRRVLGDELVDRVINGRAGGIAWFMPDVTSHADGP